MARGRLVSRRISQSRKFAALNCDTHRLMYLLILPHVDREGRHGADPLDLAGLCFTRLRYTEEVISAGLEDLADVGLITLYEAHGEPYLEITDFASHNTPHIREPASVIPAPPKLATDEHTQDKPKAYLGNNFDTSRKNQGYDDLKAGLNEEMRTRPSNPFTHEPASAQPASTRESTLAADEHALGLPKVHLRSAEVNRIEVKEEVEGEVEVNESPPPTPLEPTSPPANSADATRSESKPEKLKNQKPPKKEKPVNPHGRFDPLAVELPSCVPAETWALWVRYRIERKKALTPTSVQQQLAFLSRHPGRAAEIIEASIRNGWQGLFPPKAGNGLAAPAPPADPQGCARQLPPIGSLVMHPNVRGPTPVRCHHTNGEITIEPGWRVWPREVVPCPQ